MYVGPSTTSMLPQTLQNRGSSGLSVYESPVSSRRIGGRL